MATRPLLTGSSSATIKSHNLRAILYALLRQEPISRVRLAQLTGLSTTTITNLIAELLAQGLVAEEGLEETEEPRSVGRPRTALRLVADARAVLGVHIGVGRIYLALTDLRGRPQDCVTWEHAVEQSPEAVLEEVARRATELVVRNGREARAVLGVGVGASGLVDPETGINLFAPNLGWHDVAIRHQLAARLPWPVCVDNNVRAMALGEALFGAGQAVNVMAFVYARVGVGAGFVVGGEPYAGSGAGAGEIGHTTLIAEGGELCRCGNTGCLETLVSEATLIRRAEARAAQEPTGILAACLRTGEGSPVERLLAAARAGDEAARAILHDAAHSMGIALANLVNVLNPELIVLGGLFAQGQDLLLPEAEATMRQRAFAHLGDRVQVRPATFGRQAGVIGAAALALRQFFYQQ